jgi:hypothetical protein
MVLFMQYFIALYIKTPVGIAGDGAESFVGFISQYCAAFAQVWIPDRINDAYFIR